MERNGTGTSYYDKQPRLLAGLLFWIGCGIITAYGDLRSDIMRKWGDRYDAYRIRDIDGVHFYMAYLMPKRTQAEVYIN